MTGEVSVPQLSARSIGRVDPEIESMLTSWIRREDRQGWTPRTRTPVSAVPARRRAGRRPAIERLEDLVLLSLPGSGTLGVPPVVSLSGSGTSGGTTLVKDILPGPNGAFPTPLVNAGGSLFFLSIDQNKANNSLWVSDGTAAGTIDLTPGLEASTPRALGSTVVFTAFDLTSHGFGVWTSDGTAAGTRQIGTLPRSSPDSGASANGVVYFDIRNSVTNRFELWKSDGTTAGTGFITNIPSPSSLSFVAVGSKVFFTANDPTAGNELWVSDGTASGTHLVSDINPGPNGSFPSALTAVGGTLFFTASSSFVAPVQLWQTDGTAAGTHQVAPSVQPQDLANLGGKLVFTAFDLSGNNPSLWSTDGSPAGTTQVASLPSGFPFMMAAGGSRAYFGLEPDSDPGFQLWTTDGTAAGTRAVATLTDASTLTVSGGRLYFTVDDPTTGNELWSSDGTAAGTALVADIAPGSAGSYPGNLTDVGGTLYFTANDGTHGNELWKTSPPVPPVATTLDEGGTFSDAGSFTDAATDAPWTATVDYGDGTGPQALPLGLDHTFNLSHQYLDSGSFVITVSVTGANVLSGTATLGVTVGNLAPSAAIADAPASSPEGTPIRLTASVTDPSPSDTAAGFTDVWTVTRNGASYRSGSGTSFVFTPDDNGVYVVTLTAQDKDHSISTPATQTIVVTNVAPSATLVGAPASSPEGTAISLLASVADPGLADVAAGLVESWSVTKNGSPLATGGGLSFGFVPDDDGTYVVTLTVQDKDGGTTSAVATIQVTDVAPSASLGGDASGVRGQTRGFTLAVADPSPVDTAAGFTYHVSWGDGSPDQVIASGQSSILSHVFTATGTYTVTATAIDKDGGESALATRVVTIDAVALQPDPADPSKTALVVGGTTGDDTIRFRTINDGTGILVRLNGQLLGTYTPTGHLIAFGQAGDDDIMVSSSITLPAILHGGAGDDLLKGGGGNDILIGSSGQDTLIASKGRNLLIGGEDSDLLSDSVGEDIMISGSTSYDENDAALVAILGEWVRDVPAAQRVVDLVQGITGNIKLDPTTVFGDHAPNVVLQGGGQNWLLVDSALDVVAACGSSSIVTYLDLPLSQAGWDATLVLNYRRHRGQQS